LPLIFIINFKQIINIYNSHFNS